MTNDQTVTQAEENARGRGMDYAATFCIDALANMLGVEEYRICDGTEEWEGDVRGTLWNILVAADVIDEEDGAISRHRTAHSGEGRSGAGEDRIEEAARTAMRETEIARTDVVRPVNGSAAYTVVIFHGRRIEFHDDDWTIEQHRDAGSSKAAAYAQAINGGLFSLAKDAAIAALSAPQGEVEREGAEGRSLADDLRYLEEADAHADEGPLGEPAARSILKIALRLARNASSVESQIASGCPRALRVHAPLRFCPDCPEGDACELIAQQGGR